MDNLVSTWSKYAQILPENYVFPIGERPGSAEVPFCSNIPLIDLAAAQSPRQTIQEIRAACQEFGFFQVINHGVSQDLIDDTMKVAKDFFNMANEEKAKFYSTDPSKSCRVSTASYHDDKEHFWRDNLRHQCHPLNEYVHSWPEKPTNYRQVVGNYSLEVRKLSLRILELICDGLGLERGYFKEDLAAAQMLTINHYPRCPDPDLTLGIRKHADPNLLAVLSQGNVYGLQVFKDGQWLGVEPMPHAFVVNVGYQLQIISNGKLRSAEHRAVTNSEEDRTSIVSFIDPCQDAIIEPAKSMIDTSIPLYRPFRYRDFRKLFTEKKGDPEAVMAAYKFKR
ncbi:hyoscyamine 6-dioxygenase-like protein [Tanacetum coccineum]